MIKIVKILSLLLIFVITSCSVVPMTADAKAKYLQEEKRKADAYVLAELDCQKDLIDKKMMETRSDRSLNKKKSMNFRLSVEAKKYIYKKYKGDSTEIKKLDLLKMELSKNLETCQQALPAEVNHSK
ncbi:MAG: hypothetical protein C0598_05570 [Marinilabiliales bacterium]|nr:MAG: hypothetical protein C0598_05570 [Marinilabiliales bacterium]